MKWHWTPGGWIRVIVVVGLLVGAALLETRVPTVVFWLMITSSILIFIYSLIATSINIHRKAVEDEYDELSEEEKEVIRWARDQATK